MEDLELRTQILAIITECTRVGKRITTRALQERLNRSKYHVRREAERLSKDGLIQFRKGGYAATPLVDKDPGSPDAVAGAAFEIPLNRLMAGR